MGSTITEIEVDSARGDSVRFSAVSNFMIATNPLWKRNQPEPPKLPKELRLRMKFIIQHPNRQMCMLICSHQHQNEYLQ